jgi:electron transfer flavoprotein beta subunit
VRIIVCVKRVVDTETRVRIAPDGRSIDASGVQTIVAPYDEMAVEKAIQWREKGIAQQVTVLTAGPAEATKELRTALAMGADDAIHRVVADTGDAGATAAVLAEALRGRPFDLLLFGKQATDEDDGAVGPMVAALLGLPCVGFVFSIEPVEGKRVRVSREADGETEVLEVDLPCVLTAQKGLAEARFPGLKGIMAAKKKSLDSAPASPVPSRTRVAALRLPPPRAAVVKIEPTPDGVRRLLETLRRDRKVI